MNSNHGSAVCATSLVPTWKCHGCGLPVTEQGWIMIQFAEQWERHREFDERITRERSNRPRMELRHIGDIIEDYRDEPELAHWHAFHAACDPGYEADYDFSVERADTWPKVIGWWVHLQEKAWIGCTDWSHFVASAGAVRP